MLHGSAKTTQGRIQRFSLAGRRLWQARGARAYNGGLGAEPPAGSRGRAPGGGSAPLKLKAFWLLNVPQSRKIHPVFCFCLQSVHSEIRKGSPRARALNESGWEKFAKTRNFQPVSRRISETVQGRTNVTIND